MKRAITYGTFDFLHYGHINILRGAKELGDYLFVVLSTDEFNRNEKNKARNEHCCTKGLSERLIDVTYYSDMNELIAAADAFLSDYSSAIFEAAILRMPCFIFADDLEDYIRNRGDLFFDMYQLPFPVALKNDELIKNIINFDLVAHVKKVDDFMEQQGVVEDEHVSERTVDLIENRK